ncbi:uncharacterized protein LOC128559112 [Mercenaria mercenaria]|uniref:uncharacterized protein LOC128559112 n=1 Tax=Mercenaria mercenaria TaxID=6596 RepID=UPI00234F90F7|nr:uncharacterized protein LOC128559112 [Mercenaria mercenaria]
MEKPKSLEGEIQDKQPDSIPPQSLDMSDDVEAPSFGTAVVANPEWVGFASRQNFTGTIIGARKKGFMKVLWSDGTMEKCKFGVNGNYDFQVSKDQAVDCSHLHIGSLVARGRDWRWKDQDGGEGSVGVVLKVDGPVVHVIWPHGGQGNYRYGYNKKFDLALCKTRRNTTEETNFAWYIEEEEGQWRPFPTEVNESIENMHKTNHAGTFLVKMDEKSLRVSIQHLQARDPNTQLTYNIERRESSIEE